MKLRTIFFAAAMLSVVAPAQAQEVQGYWYCHGHSQNGNYTLLTRVFQYPRLNRQNELRNRFQSWLANYPGYQPDTQPLCFGYDTSGEAESARNDHIRQYRDEGSGVRVEEIAFSG